MPEMATTYEEYRRMIIDADGAYGTPMEEWQWLESEFLYDD